MAISQDGKRMAAYTGAERIALWDLAARQKTAELRGSASVRMLALSATGDRLALSTRNARGEEMIEIRDAKVGAVRTTLPQRAPLRSLALSPDGALLATFDERGGIALVDWAANVPLTNFLVRGLRHSGSAVVTFLPDGNRLAIGEDYGRINVVNWRTGSAVTMTHLTQEGAGITALAFSPIPGLLAAGYGTASGTIRVWDVESAEPRGVPISLTASPQALAFTPDGQQLAASSVDRTIRIWSMGNQAQTHQFRGHEGEGRFLAFLPDGRTLVSGCEVATACFWDLTVSNRPPGHVSMPISVGPGPVGALEPENLTLRALDPKAVRRFGFAFAADSRSVITTDPDGVLGVWDPQSARKLESLSGWGSNYWGVALSPDGHWLAAGQASGQVHIWRWPQRRRVTTIELPLEWFGQLQFSRSSRFLRAFAAFSDKTTRFGIWQTADWREVTPPGVQGVWTADLSPDDRLLATGYPDGTVKLWNFPSGQLQTTFTHHGKPVWFVVFSPDGRLLASTSWDRSGTVRLWDLSTWRETAPLRGHSGLVWSAAFSPDGQRLATGGSHAREALKLWDLATRRELLSLEGEGEFFARAGFSPDGSILMATSFSGIAHLWRAPSWAEIEAAERKPLAR